MRITTQLVLSLAVAMCVVLAALGVQMFRRETAQFEADRLRETRRLAKVIGISIGQVADSAPPRRTRRFVTDLDRRDSDVTINLRSEAALTGISDSQREQLSAGGSVSFIQREPRTVVAYHEAQRPGVDDQYVEVRTSLADEAGYVQGTLWRIALAAAFVLLLGTGVTFAIGRYWVERPLRALIRAAKRIGDGDLSTAVVPTGSKEYRSIAESMNAMGAALSVAWHSQEHAHAAQISAEQDLRHAERLATVGRLAAGVAHELGTPLNVIGGHARLIASGRVEGDATRTSAETVLRHQERIVEIVKQLLGYVRREPLKRQRTDIVALATETVSLLASEATTRSVSIVGPDRDRALHAVVDGPQLQQVLVNLVVNAIHASPPGHRIDIEVGQEIALPPTHKGRSPIECVYVAIKDRGGGIKEQDLPHVFDPFFTTKEVGEGTGLGLSVSHQIVVEHAGWIRVDSELGVGTEFRVYLPGLAST